MKEKGEAEVGKREGRDILTTVGKGYYRHQLYVEDLLKRKLRPYRHFVSFSYKKVDGTIHPSRDTEKVAGEEPSRAFARTHLPKDVCSCEGRERGARKQVRGKSRQRGTGGDLCCSTNSGLYNDMTTPF